MSPVKQKRSGNLGTIVIIVALLSAVGIWWLALSSEARHERDKIVAKVPAFPTKDQPARERPARPLRPTPPVVAAATPEAPQPERPDGGVIPANPTHAFVMNQPPGSTAGIVQVNALMNAPFLQRLDKCFPKEEMSQSDGGVDFSRDIDQVAFNEKGTMITGFFDDRVDGNIITCALETEPTRSYRGFTIHTCHESSLALRPGLALRSHGPASVESMIDDLLAGSPAGQTDDVYGDVYFRTSPSGNEGHHPEDAVDRVIDSALSRASALTMRANVWDSVALTLDAQPREGESVEDLEAATNGALAAVKSSVDAEDVLLTAYTDLAKVQAEDGQLKVSLALPTEKLAEFLNADCERATKRRKEYEARRAAESEGDDEPAEAGEASEEPEP